MHTIVDAVAIVAAIDNRELWHRKASRLFREIPKPMLTCEAAIAESCFLVAQAPRGLDAVMALLSSQTIVIDFSLSRELSPVEHLMRKYSDVPMSLADACLVRMSEIFEAPVFTFDSDFRVYRRNRRGIIPLIGIDN